MDAKDYVINEVLRDPRRFMVPIYQRRYQWSDTELTPFWYDLVAKADEALAGPPKFQHYMGALILAPGGDGYSVGVTPRIQVVDGQQRLTTFQLFLAALREVAKARGNESIGANVNNYLFNQMMSGDTDELARFKLSPTPADRELIHDLLSLSYDEVGLKYKEYYFQNGNLRFGSAPLAITAYHRLRDRVLDYVRYGLAEASEREIGDIPDGDTDDQLANQRLQALLQALLSHMKLVVISLGEGDDAQVIFETLNSKGKPLLAMDLVRNNIFHRAEAQGEAAEALYRRLWGTFEEPFWEQIGPRARPARPRIDHFLSHALTAQTGAATSMRELYAEYRAFARPKGTPRFAKVEDELIALTRYAPAYKTLEGETRDGSALAWLGSKLATWEVTTAYPVAFQVADAGVHEAEAHIIYKMLYSYVVRRAVSGLTAKNLNNVFQRVGTKFLKDGPSAQSFAEAFSDQTGTAVRFPTDDEFRLAFMTNPFYLWFSKGGRLPDILWELELASRSKFTDGSNRPDNLWVEHVMPQTWHTNWPLPDGRYLDRANASGSELTLISDRDALIQTVGNLTLATDRLNISIGNSSFSSKQASFASESLLALNKWFVGKNDWDENAIKERSAYLADRALAIWPSPMAALQRG